MHLAQTSLKQGNLGMANKPLSTPVSQAIQQVKNMTVPKPAISSDDHIQKLWTAMKEQTIVPEVSTTGGPFTKGPIDYLERGLDQEYQTTAHQVDDMKTYQDYLTIAEQYEKLSQTEGISEDLKARSLAIVENIKLYVAQQASGNIVGSEITKQSSEYLSHFDYKLDGKISDLVSSKTGDYSTAGLGLDDFNEEYKSMSIDEMKSVLSSAQTKLEDANQTIKEIYENETGEKAIRDSVYQPLSKENYNSVRGELAEGMNAVNEGSLAGEYYGDLSLLPVMDDDEMNDYLEEVDGWLSQKISDNETKNTVINEMPA